MSAESRTVLKAVLRKNCDLFLLYALFLVITFGG